MSRRVRVMHLITRLELGGAQQNTLYCTRHHDRRRFDVVLVAGQGGYLDDEARAIADARVELVPYLRHPVAPLSDLGAALRLRRFLREERIDLVHTHSSKAGIVGRFAARSAGVPAVHTVHGWSFNETQPALVRRTFIALERAAARRSARLIVVARDARDRGLELGIGRPEQYEIVRSGIDVDRFARRNGSRERLRRELGCAPDQPLVGMVACLKPQKAPLDFVEAAARVHRRRPDVRFVVAGDGQLRDRVERRVSELGLGDAFRLLGWRRDVPELLGAMDLFLLTSRFEGLPRSVLQAMAAGVPVVATAVDGTPEVVRHRESGMLVPSGEPAAASAAVLELLDDVALRERCAEQARKMLGEEFAIDRMVQRLEEIYLSVLEER